MQKRGNLGLPPWDVFHDGLSGIIDWPFGRTIILTSAFVMLLWIPLLQAPGFATILNAVQIGVVADIFLSIVPTATWMPARVALMFGGIVVTGIGSGFYIGAGLGPGPRDGLMTGLAKRGMNLAVARTSVEVIHHDHRSDFGWFYWRGNARIRVVDRPNCCAGASVVTDTPARLNQLVTVCVWLERATWCNAQVVGLFVSHLGEYCAQCVKVQ